LLLGIGATAAVVVQMLLPGNPLVRTPASLFWVSLAVLVALIPVKRMVGTQNVDLASVVTFTTLLLYGTGTAIVTGWTVGVASVLSSPSGTRKFDIERIMLDSGRCAASIAVAGLVLWGISFNKGASGGLGHAVIPRLLAAYALHLGLKAVIRSVVAGLRFGVHLWEVKRIVRDWLTPSAWIVPLAAYLLALIYLNSAVLTITLLASVLLIHGLTVGEEHRSRSSWTRLTDGLRQACDGHVIKPRGETRKVVETATAMGRKMRLPPRNLTLLGHAAALHNVGYIALDSNLVIRPGNLSAEDLAAVRQHPECSREILREVAGMEEVAEIVRCHHESPDGSGYPRSLEADAIPIEAAIVKVAEAFAAMTSPRVYRGKTLSRDQALEEIAKAAGRAFDPIVAYYLFETMGRGDLAANIVREFGLPEGRAIEARLSKQVRSTKPRSVSAGAPGHSIATGLALLVGALAITIVFNRFGISRPLVGPPIWFALNTPGAVFLLALLAPAILTSTRLACGAYGSWASAVVLAMALAGGPIYIPISGMALIGWALILRPACRQKQHSATSWYRNPAGAESRDPTDGNEESGGSSRGFEEPLRRLHQGVLARMGRANRIKRQAAPVTYSLVLMLAGGSAWTVCWLGYQVWGNSLVGLILSPLLAGVLGTGTFYLVETWSQAGLLSKSGPSPRRVWYRNYAGVFPEPLTYAIFGYGVYLASGLLGLWTTMAFFAIPTLWRHRVLVNRINTFRTTGDLVRSIVRAVERKNGQSVGHAADVATTAVAVARQMGKSESFVEDLEDAAVLHDIGKASWSNKVLTQRIPWNAEEEHHRYIHPGMSAEIAALAGYPEAVANMIRSHHELYDGTGYMRGLKGPQIPLGARILCAADSFSSMIQAGDPRFGRTLPETVREMRFGSGRQFDPGAVRALLEVLESAVFSGPSEDEPREPVGVAEAVDAGV
jgi:putative nucleotidyltransferase with HDIG domain